MNYEDLYEALTPFGKELKESVSSITKLQKTIQKDADTGNLSEMKKSLSALKEAAELLSSRIGNYEKAASTFDAEHYFVSGDFSKQLLASCEEKGVNVKGDKGIYEMFPYKIRVAAETQEVFMDRKKLPGFRPSYIAETIRAGQEKLNKASFKSAPFLSELAAAYETTCLRSGARIGSNQMLTKIYKNLVPMARARKEYDMQAFAFDLARLYEGGNDAWIEEKTGIHYTVGTSRTGKGIRVLSKAGVETYIETFSSIATIDD